MKKPRVCILKTDGTNCDVETAHAFELAGAESRTVLLTRLLKHPQLLNEFDILALPGGFSYGDDIASGTLFALELMQFLREELAGFVAQGKLIIGICNGFQVLVRAKLLPDLSAKSQQATLLTNDSGKYECRWTSLQVEQTNCVFTTGLAEKEMMLPVAHAEGKFFVQKQQLAQLEKRKQVVLRYIADHEATQTYPHNPNGSLHAIAGLCDTTGRVLGLMPHPERFIYSYQHPERTRKKVEPMGLKLFENAVRYVGGAI